MPQFRRVHAVDIRAVYPIAAGQVLDGLVPYMDRLPYLDLDGFSAEYRRVAVIVRHGERHGMLLVADRWADGRNTISIWIDASFFSVNSEPGDRAFGEDLLRGYLQMTGTNIAISEIREPIIRALFEDR